MSTGITLPLYYKVALERSLQEKKKGGGSISFLN